MHYEDLIDRLRKGTKLPMLAALMNEAADAIEELTAAEVRPVVRCRECKHRFNYPICACRGDDWFCGYGEKREES